MRQSSLEQFLSPRSRSLRHVPSVVREVRLLRR
jgi:hypothetical protein